MRFFIRKRRQTPTVIVVALIDVLIVLVIFLIVTTTFKNQPSFRLALPKSSQAKLAGATNDPPLIVSITTNGQFFLGPDKLPVTLDRLKSELVSRKEKDPELKVAIRADRASSVEYFFNAMDAVKEAGISTVDAFADKAAP